MHVYRSTLHIVIRWGFFFWSERPPNSTAIGQWEHKTNTIQLPSAELQTTASPPLIILNAYGNTPILQSPWMPHSLLYIVRVTHFKTSSVSVSRILSFKAFMGRDNILCLQSKDSVLKVKPPKSQMLSRPWLTPSPVFICSICPLWRSLLALYSYVPSAHCGDHWQLRFFTCAWDSDLQPWRRMSGGVCLGLAQINALLVSALDMQMSTKYPSQNKPLSCSSQR